ncbi:MAG: helix-turn-helix transcriptional regulator [Limnochordales bacterium]|nr:helix-turn-helix transcriptional regulator [Limnochordales bacterium]
MQVTLRQARRERGLTQLQLAELVGVSRQLIQAIEAGKRTPSLGVASRLSSVLGLPMEAIASATMAHHRANREVQEVAEKGGETSVPGSVQRTGGRDEAERLAG